MKKIKKIYIIISKIVLLIEGKKMDLLGIGKINKKQMIKVIIILFAIVWFFPTLFFFVLNGHISIEEGRRKKNKRFIIFLSYIKLFQRK